MDWRVKAVVQAILSRLPLGDRVNDTLQLTFGARKSKGLAHGVKGKLRGLATMQEALSAARFDLRGKHLLEIGTGWAPVHAVYLSLLGARVTTFDVKRRLGATSYAKRALAAFLEQVPEDVDVDTEKRNTALAFLRGRIDCDMLLQALDVTYVAPAGDDFLFQLPAASVDLVFSMDVLEHVTPQDIDVILRGQRHVLSPGGFAYHDICLGDHLTSVDPSITFSNFLQYDGWLWRHLGENRLAYHNRLRSSDFLRLFQGHGADVVWSRARVDSRARDLISAGALKVSDRFAGHALEDLATSRLRVLMTGRPRPSLSSTRTRSAASRAAAS